MIGGNLKKLISLILCLLPRIAIADCDESFADAIAKRKTTSALLIISGPIIGFGGTVIVNRHFDWDGGGNQPQVQIGFGTFVGGTLMVPLGITHYFQYRRLTYVHNLLQQSKSAQGPELERFTRNTEYKLKRDLSASEISTIINYGNSTGIFCQTNRLHSVRSIQQYTFEHLEGNRTIIQGPPKSADVVYEYDFTSPPKNNFVLDNRDGQWHVIGANVEPFEFLDDPNDSDIFTANLVSIRSEDNRLIVDYELHTDGDGNQHSQMVYDSNGHLVSFIEHFEIIGGCGVTATNQIPDYRSNQSPQIQYRIYSPFEREWNKNDSNVSTISESLRQECQGELEILEDLLSTSRPVWTTIDDFPELILSSFGDSSTH